MDELQKIEKIEKILASRSEVDKTSIPLIEKTALVQAYSYGFKSLGKFLGKLLGYSDKHLKALQNESIIRVSIHCNWLLPGELRLLWNKMSKGKFTWNKILIVKNPAKANFHVVINSTNEKIDFSRTIIFQMEPNMNNHPDIWGEWANPDPQKFFRVFTHKNSFNNCEWHLGSSYIQLKNRVVKNPELSGIISSVLSAKYHDPGHIKRIDFAKFLDSKEDITLHVFGHDSGFKNYKGSLPYHNKNDAMMPYFYTFNVENQEIPNYFTEKIIDSILSESLIFYHGPRNIRDYFDERAFVWLDLEDFESDYNLIKKVILEDWRTIRLPYIKKEKERILEDLQFYPRLEKILHNCDSKIKL